jgi:hypothetical protein
MQQERIDGHQITVQGVAAECAPLHARDVFPPAVPDGLDAAANPQGGTIDLSWTPVRSPGNTPGAIGYFVYRRIVGDVAEDAAPPLRISGKQPIPAPAWSDPSAKTGVRYAYSVSAIDESGKESSRSTEITTELHAADRE